MSVSASTLVEIGDPSSGGAITSIRHNQSSGNNGSRSESTGNGWDTNPVVYPDTTIGRVVFEGGKPRLEGSLERYNPSRYFNQRTLGVLKKFVDRLSDEAEAQHYEKVLADLAEALVVNPATAEVYNKAYDELVQLGNEDLALNIVGFYRDQFRKTFQIIDGYIDEKPLEQMSQPEREARIRQERALLIYAEFVLANVRLNSINEQERELGRQFFF